MKRKLTSVISIGSAVVASLFLFACDENDNKRPTPPDPDPAPAPVVLTPREKLEKGVKLLAESENISGTASVAYVADKAGKTEYGFTYAKRGDKAAVAKGDDEYYVDLKTGYGYYPTVDGTAFEQFIPANWYGYAADAFNAELSDKIASGKLDGNITESGGAVKISFDYKTEANKYLELLSDYYDGSLYDIANELVSSSGKIIDDLLDEMNQAVTQYKEANAKLIIAMINTQLKNFGLDITFEQICIKAGITEEQYATVGNRTAGEMIAGALPLVDKISDFIADYTAGNIDIDNFDFAAAAQSAFDAMFKDEIPQEALDSLETDLDDMKTKLLSALHTVKVKTVIDTVVEKTGFEDIRTAVANAVKFTALRAEFTVSFDEKGCISAINYAASAAHDYTPAAVAAEGGSEIGDDPIVNISLFDDNNYSVAGVVTFDTAASDEIAAPSGLVGLGERVVLSAVAGRGETSVYFESGADKEAVWQQNGATLYGSDKSIIGASAVFTVRNGELVFSSELIESVRPRTGAAQLVFTGTVNSKPYEITLYVPSDYSLQSIIACGKRNYVGR